MSDADFVYLTAQTARRNMPVLTLAGGENANRRGVIIRTYRDWKNRAVAIVECEDGYRFAAKPTTLVLEEREERAS